MGEREQNSKSVIKELVLESWCLLVPDNGLLLRKACSGRIVQKWHHAHVGRGTNGNRMKEDIFKRKFKTVEFQHWESY